MSCAKWKQPNPTISEALRDVGVAALSQGQYQMALATVPHFDIADAVDKMRLEWEETEPASITG